MNLINKGIMLFSRKHNKGWLIAFFVLIPLLIFGQNTLVFKNLNDKEVIEQLTAKLDIKFNFNHEILDDEIHTFSVSGDVDSILKIVEKKLGFNIVFLEGKIYAINNNETRGIQIEPSFEFLVFDEEGNSLPSCNIIIPNLDKVFQTDVDGLCKIDGYFADREAIQISYVGFETYSTTLEQLRNIEKVKLRSAVHVLGEIVLTEFLSSHQSNELGNHEKLQEIEIAGISDQDLLKKAQLLPGIHSTSESLNDLQIRGGPPDQVSYKWNDIRLLQTSLFYGKVSGVNPFLVDDISITRNGTSADQSGQASGSILLESSEKINNTTKLKLFSDLLYMNLGLHIPIVKDHLSAKVAYRKSHNYLFDTKLYREYFEQSFQFGQLENDQFYVDFYDIRGQEEIKQRFDFDDLSGNIIWQLGSKTQINASMISIGNDFQYDYFDGLFTDETKSDQLQISNKGWSVKGTHSFASNLDLNVIYSGSRYSNHYSFLRDIGQELDEDRFKENDVGQNQVSANMTYRHKHFHLNIGLQSENWQVDYFDTTRLASTGLIYTISKRETSERSAFAKIKWTFIPRTAIETGVRYSDFEFSLVDRKFIEPRLHISHTLNSRFTIHGHYGQFHQNLNRRLFSTSLEVEKGIWYLSDERPESDNFIWVVQNKQTSLGVKYLLNNWKFTGDIYQKKAENIWTSALDFAVEEDPFSFADLNVKGVELSSHYQNQNWKLIWTYELTDETMTIKRDAYYDIKSPFTQRHKISLMQSYKRGTWTVSSRWRYNSGRRFSKGERFTVETEPELYYGLEYESILEEKISPYHSLDVSINYKWLINKEKNRWFELGFHIQNLYARENIIKRQYFIDYTKTPFEMSFYDRKGLGFTPNISLRLNI